MKILLAFTLFLGLTFISCKESSSKNNQANQKTNNETTNEPLIDSLIIYQTENLIIKKLSNHIYEHISYLNTDDFGKVACNGMLVINENEGVLFDTPTDKKSSIELINFVTKELKCKIIALIPTHFHNDCVGGLAEFEEHNIPTYASKQTIELLKENGQKFSQPIKDFTDSLTLDIGNKKVYADYFGEGHTKDNIVGYFPNDKAVFGGCLIKEVGASKGYLADANINEWSKTVVKVKQKYPNAKIVIPGHGKWGNTELFDYTIKLFE
ncbi:subclass B1 metallo-beta-lactamase [Winogradskyella sp. UBA3174]|uniref:subclass B1 metallo-beta-lactamase n=1 Tax=Winogradskyella sp. UBA3174 TaxID=1947785 RepID=UPI0025E6FC1D|nr:subclass B1 metallo-beta-lactamase [Winogradskyella sp. UBA3174]|tara:strand:+ start:91 stop:891 length:801 start_codon:yes stop_codon:yes gene_type:complete